MITRRKFLIGSGVTVAALALWVAWPEADKLPLGVKDESDEEYRGFWLHLTEDGKVIFLSPSTEIGQGTHSGFAQIVAQNFDVAYEDIEVIDAPAIDGYGNPKSFNMRITGGSTSMTGFYHPLTQAMQQARQMMLNAAASEWGTTVENLSTKSGHVLHSDGQSLPYGSLISAASRLPIPEAGRVSANTTSLIGQSLPRVDMHDKVTGHAEYGVDVSLPNMALGSLRFYPQFGSNKTQPTNLSDVESMAGVLSTINTETGIVVIAKTTWHAMQACAAIEFPADSESKHNDQIVTDKLDDALDAEGIKSPSGSQVFQAEFSVPYLAHQTMEPQSCVADAQSDQVSIWTGTQAQDNARKAAAQAADIDEEKVSVHTVFAGGGFGRRAEVDMVAPAVEASKHLGQPVKIIYSRETDVHNDFYRPATKARVQIGLDEKGDITEWNQQYATQSILSRIAVPVFDWIDYDPLALEGARKLPYKMADIKTEVGLISTDFNVGFWRSVGHTYTGFVVESSIDALAKMASKDPWQFRYDLLADHPRFQRVLTRIKAMSGWDKALPDGVARGLAIVESFGSICAEVVEVSSVDNQPKIHNTFVVADCGIAVNPDVIKQQMEGGLIMGLSAALYEQINMQEGKPKQSNFHDYPVMRLAQMPSSITVDIIAEGDEIGGIGEIAVPPAAPALANAWFALTGERRLSLPFNA